MLINKLIWLVNISQQQSQIDVILVKISFANKQIIFEKKVAEKCWSEGFNSISSPELFFCVQF